MVRCRYRCYAVECWDVSGNDRSKGETVPVVYLAKFHPLQEAEGQIDSYGYLELLTTDPEFFRAGRDYQLDLTACASPTRLSTST